MSPIEFVMLKQRKQVILAAGIVFASLWFILVVYLLMGGGKQQPTINPGAVAVHAPSVTGGGVPSATYSAPRPASSFLLHHSTPSPIRWSYLENAPQASMSSTSMRLYQTSDATVHSIGGGGASGGIIATSSSTGNSNSRSGRYTALAYTGSIYIPKTRNAVTEVGASNANSEATTTMQEGGSNFKHIRRVDGPPQIPFPDPIGDTPWILMALLTIGWCVRLRLRKLKECNTDK